MVLKNKRNKALITLGAAIVLVLVFLFLAQAITKYTGFVVSEDPSGDFESCFKGKQAVLFISSESPEDILKKMKITDYLDNFEIFNCFENNEYCVENGIINFPTWIINENKISGEIDLGQLAEFSGCSISQSSN